ncbi:MAG: hypothetical protein KJ771_07670 [Nanoarchaeota archaeon]|nr:hypothetical protein [Nanoarchaeota archaeon]
MTEKNIKELKKELSEKQTQNVKLMWKYANWEWRLIMVLGCLSLFYICFKIGQGIVSALLL